MEIDVRETIVKILHKHLCSGKLCQNCDLPINNKGYTRKYSETCKLTAARNLINSKSIPCSFAILHHIANAKDIAIEIDQKTDYIKLIINSHMNGVLVVNLGKPICTCDIPTNQECEMIIEVAIMLPDDRMVVVRPEEKFQVEIPNGMNLTVGEMKCIVEFTESIRNWVGVNNER